MTLGQRRILYTLFIMAFFAITPVVWLYASGYKIGSGLKVQKTGILILDTAPRGARVYLNGVSQEYFFGRYLRSRQEHIWHLRYPPFQLRLTRGYFFRRKPHP